MGLNLVPSCRACHSAWAPYLQGLLVCFEHSVRDLACLGACLMLDLALLDLAYLDLALLDLALLDLAVLAVMAVMAVKACCG